MTRIDEDRVYESPEIAAELASRRLAAALDRAEAETRGGAVPAAAERAVRAAFDAWVAALDAFLATRPGPEREARAREAVREALLPWLKRTRLARRAWEKPLGYAGDPVVIAWIYEGRGGGTGPVGTLFDQCFLDAAPGRAVRNRRRLLVEQIRHAVAASGGHARITSLASGPAAEVFDALAELEHPERVRFTLVDIDPAALDRARDRARRLGVEVATRRLNLVEVARGREELGLADQDLVYSIGLVDYFADELVVGLLDAIHPTLRPGGRAILGNFHPRNPARGVMDLLLDWKLIHRTEADMDRLFAASAFGRRCERILWEPERINLFACGLR